MNESTGVETVRGLSLKVRAGEIYGVAGVDGNGQRELIYGITGLAKKTGQVIIEGEDVSNATPKQILDKSVAHIPEDRRGRGLVLQMPIRHNLVLDTFDNKMFTKGFFMPFGSRTNIKSGSNMMFKIPPPLSPMLACLE